MRWRVLTTLLLIGILAFAAFLRLTGQNWDDFSYTHPDERFLTVLLLPSVGGANEYTDDEVNFPSQSLFVRHDEERLLRAIDIARDARLRVGTARESFSSEVARWIAPAAQHVEFENDWMAVDALQSGQVDVVVASNREGEGARILDTLDSRQLQSFRCGHLYPDAGGIGGYFDARCSPLNPHQAGHGFYVYGTLPLFLAHFGSQIVQDAVNAGLPIFDWQGGHLVWRGLSMIFDLISILLIFALGQRMHNRWVGLIAAILYAAAPLAIQKAHFGTTNAIAACMVTLALYFAVAVQQRGKLSHYLLFGVACGLAVASRINLAPLAGIIVAAALFQVAPIFDSRLEMRERRRLLGYHAFGLVLAGLGAFLAFRIFNPYTFVGPGFFDILPNDRWFENLSSGSFGVSGLQDSPPNWQWLSRAAYFYPLKDMFLWAMGLPMALLAWFAWLWSMLGIAKGREAALRNLLLVLWIGVYFLWMNQIWAMTMRYYFPLYSALAIMAGWALHRLYQGARMNREDFPVTRLLLIVLGMAFGGVGCYQIVNGISDATSITAAAIAAALFAVALLPQFRAKRAIVLGIFAIGFTGIWGLMFGNVYRHQSTLVQSSRYLFERVPGDFAMRIEGADDTVPLINLAIGSSNYQQQLSGADELLTRSVTAYFADQPQGAMFVAPGSGTITSIYAPHLGDALDDPLPEGLTIRVFGENQPAILAEARLVADLRRDTHPLGNSYDIPFEQPFTVEKDSRYRVEVILDADSGAVIGSGSVVLTEGNWDNRVTGIHTCELPDGMTLSDRPASGLRGMHDCRGVQAFWSLVNSYDQIMSFPLDNATKYEHILRSLDLGDYLTIASNRFYDTQTRNPMRWPLTTLYYDKLFAGELGYELAAVFDESFELGPWRVSDQHLPIYQSPAWLNEMEADEAFHVYDHPAVFIFRKTADYSRAQVEAALSPVSLKQFHELSLYQEEAQIMGVVYRDSYLADPAPTALMFPAADYETQRSGGSWSERFFSESFANSNQAFGAVFWYALLLIIGIAAFPLVYAIFPNMADGGYGVSKLTGLLLVAWFAWAASSLKAPLWSQAGLMIFLLGLVLTSALLAYRNRARLIAFLRDNWRRLAWMEAIALLAFLFMIAVRLSNPDLWHPFKGGEKPMNFAYLNGVLRSTIFPPIDPWFAGGFINYYYFGYVLVGAPALLLGIAPSFAYNLMIPTVFSLTGSGAFSAAFNIVSRWHRREPASEKAVGSSARRLGNPWLAGVMALLMCIVLGNLDTVRVLGQGVAELGGYQKPQGLVEFLNEEYREEYGVEAAGAARAELAERAAQSHLFDNLRYEIHNSTSLVGGVIGGAGRLLAGEPLGLGSDRWYWGPSRVLAETPGVRGNAITEMPYFTFLYGDLHAHMINMPLILLTALFVFNALTQTGRDQRKPLERFLALALGGLAVGVMRATNTWDWPSMTLFAVIGLGYCWWIRWQPTFRGGVDFRFHRSLLGILLAVAAVSMFLLAQTGPAVDESGLSPARVFEAVRAASLLGIGLIALWLASRHLLTRSSAIDLVATVGGFLALNFAFALPYTTWHATTYNSAQLWQGGKTPLWAYFDIHGLFLFLLVSLLTWETVSWLRSTPVQSLRGRMASVKFGSGAILAMLALSILLALAHYQVALIALPLLSWIALLFFRPGQSRSMRYLLVLIGLALSMTLGVEFIVIGGDIERQNTVFKFYIQVWLLFSVAGGAAFSALWRSTAQWQSRLRRLWLAACVGLFAVAGAFPIVATRARSLDRMAPDLPLTLDGLDYMTQSTHQESAPDKGRFEIIDLNVDYQLIRWLQENVRGTPVIMEGRGYPSEYQWNGRISITTGLPSVVGWNFHQRQQRTLDPLPRWVDQREQNVRTFYDTPRIDVAVNVLNHFDVKYVIRSGLEEVHSTEEGLAKFDRMVEMGLLSIAYAVDGGVIYQVNDDALTAYLLER